MDKLYGYWRSSAAYRVRIAVNLKQLKVEQLSVHLVKGGGEQFSEAYRELNPQSLVPTWVTDSGSDDKQADSSSKASESSRALSQSLAIIEYLDEKYPQVPLLPANLEDRAVVRAMAQLVACDIHPLNNLRVLAYLKDELAMDDGAKHRWYCHWIAQGFEALESTLSAYSGRYCFGDSVSLADVCLIPQIYNARRFKMDLSLYPQIVKIWQQCHTLPAFVEAAPEKQMDAIG